MDLAASSSALATALVIVVLLPIVVAWLAIVAGTWKLFVKAGRHGWESLIPFWILIALCAIAGRPWWWSVAIFVPILNLVFLCALALDIAKAFGKNPLFGIGLFLIPWIMYPVLGFSNARYLGPRSHGVFGASSEHGGQGPQDLLSSI